MKPSLIEYLGRHMSTSRLRKLRTGFCKMDQHLGRQLPIIEVADSSDLPLSLYLLGVPVPKPFTFPGHSGSFFCFFDHLMLSTILVCGTLKKLKQRL